MVFTTNKPLSAWGRVLHDPDLARAILDRVLERGRHLELRGPSYRTRHAKLDLTQDPESSSMAPAGISGNRSPEFPEPTVRFPRPDHCTAKRAPRFRGHIFLSGDSSLSRAIFCLLFHEQGQATSAANHDRASG